MKRFLARLAFCGLLALTSCAAFDRGASPGPAELTGAAPVLGRIVARGELLVGTSGNQPPLNATTKAGEIIGLEADLAGAMAQAMGVTLRFVPMPFGELLPALERGTVDVVLSSVTMTPQRNTRVAFVGPYFVSGKALLTKSKRMAAIKESGEIDNASTTLAALEGSTSQAFVQNAIPRARLVTVKDYDRAVGMVIDGSVDALVADFTFCVVSTLRHPKEKLATLVAPLTFEPLGVALPAGDPLLVNWMENFLLMLEGSGAMDDLRTRWFQSGSWIADLR
jgi:polar amino acid transport system substrate-binding protein